MPWRAASPMDQRTQFVADFLRDTLSITELCALYGVSRKTGYKWIDRYLRAGQAGLEERSRRPRRSAGNHSAKLATRPERSIRLRRRGWPAYRVRHDRAGRTDRAGRSWTYQKPAGAT